MNILAFLQAPSSKPDPLLAGIHGIKKPVERARRLVAF
jgi:hypothetical protein